MLTSILSGAPIWVWPLLALLIAVGIMASRDRSISLIPLYFLPFLGLLSINAVNGLPAAGLVWVAFGVMFILGAMTGYWRQKAYIIAKASGRISMRGEWLTMTQMMVIFWMNFIGGIFQAVAPDFYASNGFLISFASVAGFIAGIFVGRTARVLATPST